MKREKLDELERLAKAATPGPWENGVVAGNAYDFVADKTSSIFNTVSDKSTETEWHQICIPDTEIIITETGCGERSAANAAFIAACSPETILALIDRIRALEGK